MVNIMLQITAVPQISDPSNFTRQFEQLYPTWIANVYPYATDLFWALALLDISVFGWTLIRRHGNDVQGAILSTVNRIVLIGAFLALLMNGSSWMGALINMFITVGKAGSGVGAIQPSVVLSQGIKISFALLNQSTLSGAIANPMVAACMGIAALLILASFIVITIEFVITKVQTFLALGMGFFFFGFGGSGWTRNHVERYFSYATSVGVRLMANYFLIGTGLVLAKGWLAQAQASPWSLDGVKAAWITMSSAALFAVLAWKGSAVAAQLLGGGPNLSHGDIFHAMGAAAQAGASAALMGGSVLAATGGAAASMASGSGSAAGAAIAGGGASPAAGGSVPSSKPAMSMASAGRDAYQLGSAAAGALHAAGGSGSHQVHTPPLRGFEGHD